jgi:FAD/FMN-containing dehydrogenase
MNELSELGHVVQGIKQLHPECFELFDDHTLKLAAKYAPEMMQKMGGKSLSLLYRFLPELWMSLTGGFPKLVLLAEFSANTEAEAESKASKAATLAKSQFNLKSHIAESAEEAAKYWTIRRESYNLLRQHTKNRIAACFIEDVIVHPDQLPEFLPKLNAIFSRYPNFIYTIAGHAGDANFHVIPIMDLSLEENHQIIIQMSHQVYDLVLEYGGSITAEHNDGLIRTPYLEKMYGSNITGLFKAVKEIFDPLYIFNPGKKVGATEQYIIDHIKRG